MKFLLIRIPAMLLLLVAAQSSAQDAGSPEIPRILPEVAPLKNPPATSIKDAPQPEQEKAKPEFEAMLMIYATPAAKAAYGYDDLNTSLHKELPPRIKATVGSSHVSFGMRAPEAKVSMGMTIEIREFMYAPAGNKGARAVLVAHVVSKDLHTGKMIVDTLFDSRSAAYADPTYNISDRQVESLLSVITDAVATDPKAVAPMAAPVH